MVFTPAGEKKSYKLKDNGSLLKPMPRAPYRRYPPVPQTGLISDIPVEPGAFCEISGPEDSLYLAWEERAQLTPPV